MNIAQNIGCHHPPYRPHLYAYTISQLHAITSNFVNCQKENTKQTSKFQIPNSNQLTSWGG